MALAVTTNKLWSSLCRHSLSCNKALQIKGFPTRHFLGSSLHTTKTGSWELEEESIFSKDHEQLRSSLRKIIDKDINPFVEAWEDEKIFPAHQVFKTLGNAGFLGVNKPPEYGGLGLDFSYSIAVGEELGSIKCGALPMAIGVQTDMATPALARFGSHELKEQFLAPAIRGDAVACLGVSEPHAGSDVANIKTTAKADGDDVIINGGKMWTTNGSQADWMCLLANTNPDAPMYQDKSLFCLPMDTPGIHVSRTIDKIGMHASDTAQIFFEDVRIPKKFMIGEEGYGFTYQMLQFQEERLFAAIGVLMPMEIAIGETIEYCKQRKIFGKSIIDNQVVHFRLAELQSEVEALRSMIYRACGLYIKGHDVTSLASMCKLKAGRLAREVSDSCLQFWGGMGFTKENIISQYYRDFRLLSIGGGADEVMLQIICKYMGTLPKPTKK